MATKSPSNPRTRVSSAKRWGSSAKPISSQTQPSRPTTQEPQDQGSIGHDRPKSGLSPKGRPLSSNVYLKKTIAKGWEAQEVPTEELSQEELDKLVADEVESLREKKKALEGMLTSQGLGASDQTLHPDWVKGEVMIPDFHCARCRDLFYGLTDEPCEEELERLKREGLWGGGEKNEEELSPKSRRQRETGTRSPLLKRGETGRTDSSHEKKGSRISSSVGSRHKATGRVDGGTEGTHGEGRGINNGRTRGTRSSEDTLAVDRNVDSDISTARKLNSSGKGNGEESELVHGDVCDGDCMKDTHIMQDEGRERGSDKIRDIRTNSSYGSNSNGAGAYLGKSGEVGGFKGDKLGSGKGKKDRRVKSDRGVNGSDTVSDSESSGEETSGTSGRKKRSHRRREKVEEGEIGGVLDGTDGDGVGVSINRNRARNGVSKDGANVSESVALGADTISEEQLRAEGSEASKRAEEDRNREMSGGFSHRDVSSEWERVASRDRKVSHNVAEGVDGGDRDNHIERRGVLASAGPYRQTEGTERDLRSPSQILSGLLNKRPSTANASLHSQFGFAVSNPYTFSYYNS